MGKNKFFFVYPAFKKAGFFIFIFNMSEFVYTRDKSILLSLEVWCRDFSDILGRNLADEEFRGIIVKDNPDGLWRRRPPELRALDCIDQSWPHTQTVGEHTYNVLQSLRTEITLNGINYLSARPAMVAVLRAATLFHDIGKRTGPDNFNHPFDSAQQAESYLRMMGFNDNQRRLCLHLIGNHDVLGKVSNPKARETIEDIVKLCQTPAILQCLLALTIADISNIKGLMQNPRILNDVLAAANLAYAKIAFLNRREQIFYSFRSK